MKQLMSALMRKSLADVTRRKARTAVVVLGILIGVFGLTAINVVEDTVIAAVAFSANESTQPDISFSVQAVAPSLASTLAAVPNVQTVQIETNYDTHWHISPIGKVGITIIGYQDLRHVALAGFQLTSGHYPGAGEIVLETGDRALQSFMLGNQITVEMPQGTALLRVVGTSRTIGLAGPASTGAARGYMSADMLEHLIGATGGNDIEIQVRNTAQVNQTLGMLANVLKANHVTVLLGLVHNNPGSNNSSSGLLNVLRLLVTIAIGLASLVIINTVTTLIAEQIQIIGTMKVLGGTRGTILRSYLLTVSIYGVLGTILGLMLGIAVGYTLASQALSRLTLDMGPFTVSPSVLSIGLAVGLGVPLLAALLPVWIGTHITVREALAAYGVSAGSGRGHLQRVLLQRLIWVPQTLWLGMRSIFRQHGRTVLTLLVLILSGITFLAIATATYSINAKITNLYANYDYDIQLETATSPQPWSELRTQVLAVPNVQRVERVGNTGVTTKWGHIHLTGIDTDTQLYHPQLIAGHWFTPNERNVVLLSDDLASTTGLRVGNTLTFSYLEHPVTWTVIGIIHDLRADVAEIGGAVTTSEGFNLLTDNPANSAQTLMVQAYDRSPTAVDQLVVRLDATLTQAGLKVYVGLEQSEIQQDQQQFLPLYVMLYTPTVIVALVGILGLYNTLMTSVLERRREIGIWRAMGASGSRVALVFWVEALTLAGIAWGVSAVLGVLTAFGFVQLLNRWLLFHVTFVFDPASLSVMLAVILVIATLASFGPTWHAARMRIADTLRYE